MKNYGFYQVATASFETRVADVKWNTKQVLSCISKAPNYLQLMVFGELTLSGYTCQDLFYNDLLLEECIEGLAQIIKSARENLLIVVGLPLKHEGRLYNVAAFIFNHELLGFQVKSYLPNYREFYEKRWFSSGKELNNKEVQLFGRSVPISTHLLVKDETTKACIGAEICEDLWVPCPVSSEHALHGANVIVNLSASDELISKKMYREDLVKMQSSKLICAYLYASGGYHESTSDLLFSMQQIIAENGQIHVSWEKEGISYATIDLEKLMHDRLQMNTYNEACLQDDYCVVSIDSLPVELTYLQPIDQYPFVCGHLKERCLEILSIQTRALEVRLSHLSSHCVILGISGGLDSTLALLVCHYLFETKQWDKKDIIAVTMPGIGTSSRTYHNATELMKLLQVTQKEIPIVEAMKIHMKDIGHDEQLFNTTYENIQARERTQILMDLGNEYGGIVIGTGDMSEIALGWCTYNGDHMAMYNINASIPKTLVSSLIQSYADLPQNSYLKPILYDILDTPISPELLPLDKQGKQLQLTENTIGEYKYHDFFLYYYMRYHFTPKKIYYLALLAHGNDAKDEIKSTLKVFFHRFFSQQFKRNCMPDGIKVGSISLSPRSDLRMPSDAKMNLWLEELETL